MKKKIMLILDTKKTKKKKRTRLVLGGMGNPEHQEVTFCVKNQTLRPCHNLPTWVLLSHDLNTRYCMDSKPRSYSYNVNWHWKKLDANTIANSVPYSVSHTAHSNSLCYPRRAPNQTTLWVRWSAVQMTAMEPFAGLKPNSSCYNQAAA